MKKLLLIIVLFLSTTHAKAIDISSQNVVLYNLNEDKVIYEKNSNEIISIASLTKIMTTIVAIENIENLNDKIIIKTRDFDGLYEADASLAGFSVGQEVTYRDLLYGTFLPSGAEATQALAFNLTGSIENFVKLMNDKAKEIGLNNTNFANTTGLDDNNNYSSVNDVAKLLKYALQNETFKEIYEAKSYITSDNELIFYSSFRYTAMKYLYDVEYVLGAKTGYTDDAGKCLASTAYDEENKISYMLVTCRASTDTTDAFHIKDATNIYKYYFDNYKYQLLINENDLLVTIKTKYGKEDYANFYINEPVLYYLHNDYDLNKVIIEYEGLNEISNKNNKGDLLGNAKIYYDNQLVTTKEIILNDEYSFSFVNYMVETKLIVLFVGIPLLIILLVLTFKYKKKKL